VYFAPQSLKPGYKACTDHCPKPILVPRKSVHSKSRVFRTLFVWNPSAFPPTRRSIKSTKTQKAEDISDEESDETDDEAPVDDERSDESDGDDDDEGRYELL